MPRDYNINISVNGGDARGAFGGGTVSKTNTTLNSNTYNNDVSSSSKMNLSRLFSVGLLFNTGQKANEIFGAYTEDRLRQRKIDTAMTFAKYGIGLAVNLPAGAIYMASDLAYRGIMYGITIQKKNREAIYFRSLSGNTSMSGRRYRGDL